MAKATKQLAWADRLLRVRVDKGGRGEAVGPPPPDPIRARAVVDLAARVGEVALSSGASAADTAAMVLRVVYSFGVRAHVDVTYTAVTVSYTHPDDLDPITRMRVIPALGMDYDLLAWLEQRVDAICGGGLSIEEARRMLWGQLRSRPRYRDWALLFAAAVQGATICGLLGGGPGEALLAALGTTLVESATRAMYRRGHPTFLRHVVAGAIPAAIGLAVMVLRLQIAPELFLLSPSLIVATGMVTMLAGMGVVGAAQDALDGFYITAAARVLDFITRTGGLVLGVAGTLWLGVQVGVPAYLVPDWLSPPTHLVQELVIVPFCVFFAMTTWLSPRATLWCGALGGAGSLVYMSAFAATGAHPLSAGVMSFSVAVAARLAGAWLRVPVMALITGAIAPLMPGMMLYRAIFPVIVGRPVVTPVDQPVALLLASIFTGLALALGASLGVMLGRRLAIPTNRIAQLANSGAWARGNGRRTPTRESKKRAAR